MLRGGGVAFGPRPSEDKFVTKLQKKVYDLAWRTALSYRFRKGELIIVDNAMEIESPSTRLLEDIFKHHERLRGRGRSMLVTLDERPLLQDALIRMGRGEETWTWKEVDVKNLLEGSRVMIERDALHNILRSHEEDLIHTAFQPWHKSIVKSSPPSDLESIIGWAEFRDLQLLDPKDLNAAARAAAYENVALNRYEAVCVLPESSPQRTELNISVYNLTAEAKALQFEDKTGMSWSEYATPPTYGPAETEDRDLEQLIQYRESCQETFPHFNALQYQIVCKSRDAEKAAQTSRAEADELELDVAGLEVQSCELLHEAALLAAQVDEHYAEAQRLAGDQGAADETILLASSERSSVSMHDTKILEAQVKLAEMKVKVLVARNVPVEEVEEAESAVEDWREKLEAKRLEDEREEAEREGEEEVKVEVERDGQVSEQYPGAQKELEQVRDMRKKEDEKK